MSLSSLPDLCLLAIFDQIPITQIFATINLVCHRWLSLKSSILQRRRSLVIVSDEFELENLLKTCSNTATNDLINVNFHHNFSIIANNVLIIPTLNYKICSKLTETLPNINSLSIIQRSVSLSQIVNLNLLFTKWSCTLTRLSLLFWPKENEEDYYLDNDDFTHCFDSLFESINSLSVLSDLQMNLNTPNYFDGQVKMHLPVVGQLAKLRLQTAGFCGIDNWTDLNMALDVLMKFGAQNRGFREIVIDNSVGLSLLLHLPPNISQAFVKADIEDVIKRTNLMNFNTFCFNFASLQSLSLHLGDISMSELAHALTHLSHLETLSLIINCDQSSDQIVLSPINSSTQLPQLCSISTLVLSIETKSHLDISQLQIPFLFPNVRTVRLRHDCVRCLDCSYHLETDDYNEIKDKIEECMRLARAPFKDCHKLTKLEANSEPLQLMNFSKNV